MSNVPACINPVLQEEMGRLSKEMPYELMSDPIKLEYMNELKPYLIDIECLNTCAGSCLACYSSSTPKSKTILPKEKVFEVIDDGVKLGTKMMAFGGGDQSLC